MTCKKANGCKKKKCKKEEKKENPGLRLCFFEIQTVLSDIKVNEKSCTLCDSNSEILDVILSLIPPLPPQTVLLFHEAVLCVTKHCVFKYQQKNNNLVRI